MKIFRNFFWFCSGANIPVLKRCPTESNKYAGIGGTVLFTGLFAGISASYALFTVFGSLGISVAFGIIWGAMIFNLDRFIVSGMKKANGWLREITMALPRLMLAVLLAFVISKPLELKIFEKEILRKIDEQKIEQSQQTRQEVFNSYPELEEWREEIVFLRQEIDEKEEFRNLKQEEYDLERFGVQSANTSGRPGIGRNARIKEQQLQDAQKDLEETRERNLNRIAQLTNQVEKIYQTRENSFEQHKATIDNYDGFAARIHALGVLTSESRAVYLANLFIILLFIAVETAPIFVKLISVKGPYDDLLQVHEKAIAENAALKLSRSAGKTTVELKENEQRSQNEVRRNLETGRVKTREIIDAEVEIARKSVAKWKEKQLMKIEKDEWQLPELQDNGSFTHPHKESESEAFENGNGNDITDATAEETSAADRKSKNNLAPGTSEIE